MEINTHGFEVDENEHDVVDEVYSELTPMLNPSRWVRLLRDRAGNEHKFACTDSEDWQIADYIEQLENQATLHQASYAGLSSLLLSVQQDCIRERNRANALAVAVISAFNEGFQAGADNGWTNNPRQLSEWKTSRARATITEFMKDTK